MIDDMRSLLQYVSNEYPSDKIRPSVTFSFLGAKGYYVSIIRYPAYDKKEVVVSAKADALEDLLPTLAATINERSARCQSNPGATSSS